MNTTALLEDLGHGVIEAYSGKDAVARFRERGDIDLVVTDQAMPGMTGVELIAAFDGIRSGVPKIIASGYGGRCGSSGWPGRAPRQTVRTIAARPIHREGYALNWTVDN